MASPTATSHLSVFRKPIGRRCIEFTSCVILVPALLLLLLWIPLITGGLGASADFIQFYAAGRIIREGHASQIYDYARQATAQREFTSNTEPLLFNHPPFEALLYAPLAQLTFPTAFVVWTFINFSMVGLVFFLLQGYGGVLGLSERLILLGCAMLPATASLLQGQDSFVILLAYTVAFLCLRAQWDFVAGGALSLALIKPQLVIPFVIVLLLKRRLKFVAGFACGAAVLLAASLLLVGLPGVIGYAKMIPAMGAISGQDAYHIFPAAMPNLRGIFYFLLGGGLTPHAIAVLTLLSSIGVFAWTIRRTGDLTNPIEKSFDFDFSSIVLMTILVSYHFLVHDLSLLILPAFLVLVNSSPVRWRGAKVALALLAAEELLLMGLGFKWYSVLVPAILGFAFLVRTSDPARQLDAGT